jgi:hypothetical protein
MYSIKLILVNTLIFKLGHLFGGDFFVLLKGIKTYEFYIFTETRLKIYTF